MVGFFCFTTFILFAVFTLIRDDVNRHNDLERRIRESIELLKGKYGCDDKEIERMIVEFEDKDAAEQAGIDEND